MAVGFTHLAYKDYQWWKKNDPAKVKRIENLCNDIEKHPFQGIGKPEPLKFSLQGCWSRRIDKANRLVYRMEGKNITVLSCRYHY